MIEKWLKKNDHNRPDYTPDDNDDDENNNKNKTADYRLQY